MPSINYLIAALTLVLAPIAQGFQLTSLDITAANTMPKAHEHQGFGCDGANLSPPLAWHNAPEGTKSYAITAYDPDAPSGSGWWHWIVFNIPAVVDQFPTGAGTPSSEVNTIGMVQHRTDYGSTGFGDACPPKGEKPHRYQFKVYELDVVQLEIAPDSSAALVGYMLNRHKLGVAELEALYQR